MPSPFERPAERLVLGYAGFWWRFLAWAADSILLLLVDALLGHLLGLRAPSLPPDAIPDTGTDASVATVADLVALPSLDPTGLHVPSGALFGAGVVLTALYFTLFESSRWRATPGKRLCRLSVTDLFGNRIGPFRALARHLAKVLSFLFLGLGFLMIAWTRRRQGLHDKVAGTLVLRRRPAEAVFAFVPPAP